SPTARMAVGTAQDGLVGYAGGRASVTVAVRTRPSAASRLGTCVTGHNHARIVNGHNWYCQGCRRHDLTFRNAMHSTTPQGGPTWPPGLNHRQPLAGRMIPSA